VGEQDPFGVSGRARRIDQNGDVVVGGRDDRFNRMFSPSLFKGVQAVGLISANIDGIDFPERRDLF